MLPRGASEIFCAEGEIVSKGGVIEKEPGEVFCMAFLVILFGEESRGAF